jgi:polyferredoxin
MKMMLVMMMMRMMRRRRKRRRADIYKRTLFYIYFILFEISTQFRWLLGNNI